MGISIIPCPYNWYYQVCFFVVVLFFFLRYLFVNLMSEESHLVALVLLSLIASESVSNSVVSDSVISWAAVHQDLLSMEFSRREYLNGLPFPSLRELLDPHCRQILNSEPPGKPLITSKASHLHFSF